MDNKTYLLSFLMMDIYARSVLSGSPSVQRELETAMDFVEQAEGMMKKRGWLEPPAFNAKVRNIEASPEHTKAYPGLRQYVMSQPSEEAAPVADATGTA